MKRVFSIFISIVALIMVIGCSNPLVTDPVAGDPVGDPVDDPNLIGVDLSSNAGNDPDSNWGVVDETIAQNSGFSTTSETEIVAALKTDHPEIFDVNGALINDMTVVGETVNAWVFDHMVAVDYGITYSSIDEVAIFPNGFDASWNGSQFEYQQNTVEYEYVYPGTDMIMTAELTLAATHVYRNMFYVHVYRALGISAYNTIWISTEDNTINKTMTASGGQIPENAPVQFATLGFEVYLPSATNVADVNDWLSFGFYNSNRNVDDFLYEVGVLGGSDFTSTSFSMPDFYGYDSFGYYEDTTTSAPTVVTVAKFGTFDELNISTWTGLGHYYTDSDTQAYVDTF